MQKVLPKWQYFFYFSSLSTNFAAQKISKMAKKKNNRTELREVALTLFLNGFNQKEIAKKLSVSEVSISRWANSDNWESLKKAILTSKIKRISELYAELAEFNAMIKNREEGSRFPNSKEADVRRKLIRDIVELETKYNIGQTTVIARDFILFVKDIDFAFSQKANEYLDAFINNLIEKQKWQEQ
jgi:transposase